MTPLRGKKTARSKISTAQLSEIGKHSIELFWNLETRLGRAGAYPLQMEIRTAQLSTMVAQFIELHFKGRGSRVPSHLPDIFENILGTEVVQIGKFTTQFEHNSFT